MGLPITLCKPGTKTPISKRWPRKIWSQAGINKAFEIHGDLNVGLILGPRSGLIDIEIDGHGGDAALLELFDNYPLVTAKWRSLRGHHYLFQWQDDLEQIGKASVTMGPLEIRIGAGGGAAQSLLPPSTTDGFEREWVAPFEDYTPVPLPPSVINKLLQTFGRRDRAVAREVVRHSTEHSIAVFHAVSHPTPAQSHSHPAQQVLAVSALRNTSLSTKAQAAIKRAIDATQPGSEGFRNRLLLQFARQLKAIPELSALDPKLLLPCVEQWYQRALPNIATKEF